MANRAHCAPHFETIPHSLRSQTQNLHSRESEELRVCEIEQLAAPSPTLAPCLPAVRRPRSQTKLQQAHLMSRFEATQ